jgi:hypothetical protein
MLLDVTGEVRYAYRAPERPRGKATFMIVARPEAGEVDEPKTGVAALRVGGSAVVLDICVALILS